MSAVLQEKKFQCEAIVEKFGILNSLLELLELCQANLVQIKLMGNTATTPVYVIFGVLNPLTPVPAVTGRGEPWPVLHFQPKLLSSLLNFCRRNRSFQ